jgi:hypothetical protein
MGFLDRLFGAFQRRDRLAKAPSGHTGGRLAPASVQRAHLGLRDVDPPTGVIRLRTGEVRAALAVGGMTLHARDADEALAFLERWAAALNALPADVVLLSRARPGGLEEYAEEKARASAALATAAPGTGLARLAADQLAHARRLMRSGAVRDVACWLAVRDATGDVRALMERVAQAANRLTAVGLTVTPLRDRALADALSRSWKPGYTQSVLLDFDVAPGAEWSLHVESDTRTTRATVKRPRYVAPPAADALPAPASSPALPHSRPPRSLSERPRKPLP